MASRDGNKCQYKKAKGFSRRIKATKKAKKVVSLEIVQDHSNKVEQTYINNNIKQEVTALQKLALSISKPSSKIHKPIFYKKAIFNPIYG